MKLTRNETKELISLVKEFLPIKLKDFYISVGKSKQAFQQMERGAHAMQFALAVMVSKEMRKYIDECEAEIAVKKAEVRNKLKKLAELKAYVNRFDNN